MTNFNDLFFLDMDTMRWEEVTAANGIENSETWPKPLWLHSLTMVSPKAALLFGGDADENINNCWMLNIEECVSRTGIANIWTQREHQEHDGRYMHKAVLEPGSKRVWVLGGLSDVSGDGDEIADHIRELAVLVSPLKALALECAANHFEKLAPEVQGLPKTDTLRRAIEAKARRKYVIS